MPLQTNGFSTYMPQTTASTGTNQVLIRTLLRCCVASAKFHVLHDWSKIAAHAEGVMLGRAGASVQALQSSLKAAARGTQRSAHKHEKRYVAA